MSARFQGECINHRELEEELGNDAGLRSIEWVHPKIQGVGVVHNLGCPDENLVKSFDLL